ncbi:MAG TPA: hypothetical protein VFU32_15590 [Ktedonobacterales bacterium]|nr:hypothetical protein [Ktedonobacterales bacterium]
MQQDLLSVLFLSHAALYQRLVAIALAFGIAILIVGESYLLAALLSHLRWPRWLSWELNLPTLVLYVGLLLFFNNVLNPGLDEHGPLEQLLLRQGILGILEGFFALIALALWMIIYRLVRIQPLKARPMPLVRWAWLALLPFVLEASVGLGLLMGLEMGLFPISPPGTFAGILTTVPVPFLHWPFAVSPPVTLVGLLLPTILAAPYLGQIFWRIERLPASRFARVGAALIGVGSVIVGVTFLLIP